MKISKLSITNVTSYNERTDFEFDDKLNILIGPNAGGKSNALRILSLVLCNYFLTQYNFQKSDDEAKIEPLEMWNQKQLRQRLDKFIGNDGDQVIEITLIPESADIENIRLISENLATFNKHMSFWEKKIDPYSPVDFVNDIENSDSLKYRIVNHIIEEPTEPSTTAFYEYLRTFFIFMRLSFRMPEVRLRSPVFFFFSERSFGGDHTVQSNQLEANNYFNQYANVYRAATGENTNLFQFASQHFTGVYWKALNEAGRQLDKEVGQVFSNDDDVKLLTKYLSRLGYLWNIYSDEDNIKYNLALVKNDKPIAGSKLSSGEKEIFHFLLAMFSLNVRDGLVLIDEPELHLHPRWQQIFLSLFTELAVDRNNQFIIATHSPVFVTPETINDITRIYQVDGSSRKTSLREVSLPEKKSLVRMINSQNNEKVFFADRVILVEGITDRLVISSLIKSYCDRFSIVDAIEVVEVGGKHNFAPYMMLLRGTKTPTSIIGDLDYLTLCGSEKSKVLFVSDYKNQWETLTKDKHSIDRRSLIRHLQHSAESCDVKELVKFLKYFDARLVTLKYDMSNADVAILEKDIASLRNDDCYVLRYGEIEDYLPEGVNSVEDVVELTESSEWILGVESEEKILNLHEIVCAVLQLANEDNANIRSSILNRESGIFARVSDA